MDGSVAVETLKEFGEKFVLCFIVFYVLESAVGALVNFFERRARERDALGDGPDLEEMDRQGIPYEVQCEQCRATGSIQEHPNHGKPKNGVH